MEVSIKGGTQNGWMVCNGQSDDTLMKIGIFNTFCTLYDVMLYYYGMVHTLYCMIDEHQSLVPSVPSGKLTWLLKMAHVDLPTESGDFP